MNTTIKSTKELVAEATKMIDTLESEEVKQLQEKGECNLIDLREIRELWKKGTIKDALHIPRGVLEFRLDPQNDYYKESKLSENKKMILFCAGGMRSALATKSLVEMGFRNVAHVRGGFAALKEGGLEVVEKEKTE